MSTDHVTLEVHPRPAAQRGTRNVKRLRAQGFIPGVFYGKQSGSHAFLVGTRDLRAALSGPSGLHTLLNVVLEGRSHSAVVKDVQRHPVRGTATHIDLHEVRLDQPIQATVALVLVGESPGARQGGFVSALAREVRIEALPTSIPEHVEVSIDTLNLGGILRLSDMVPLAGVVILDDPETVVATCMAPRGPALAEEAEGDEPEAPAVDDTSGD